MRIIRVLQFLLWSLFRFILPPCMSLVPLPTAPTGRCGISAPTHHFQCICPLTPSRINYGIALNHRRFLCSLQFNWVSTEAIKLQIAQGKPREKPPALHISELITWGVRWSAFISTTLSCPTIHTSISCSSPFLYIIIIIIYHSLHACSCTSSDINTCSSSLRIIGITDTGIKLHRVTREFNEHRRGAHIIAEFSHFRFCIPVWSDAFNRQEAVPSVPLVSDHLM